MTPDETKDRQKAANRAWNASSRVKAVVARRVVVLLPIKGKKLAGGCSVQHEAGRSGGNMVVVMRAISACRCSREGGERALLGALRCTRKSAE